MKTGSGLKKASRVLNVDKITIFVSEGKQSMETNDKLIALWTARACRLLRGADLITPSPFKKMLKEAAGIYRQCADELRDPPEDLFKKLHIG